MNFAQLTSVPASDAARHFSEMVDHVFAGHKYTIMRRNRPVALIAPLPVVWQLVLYQESDPDTVTLLGHGDGPKSGKSSGVETVSLWHLVSICPDSLAFTRTDKKISYFPAGILDAPWCDLVGETIAVHFQEFLCARTTPGRWHLHARAAQ